MTRFERLLGIWCFVLTLMVIGQTILIARQVESEKRNLILLAKQMENENTNLELISLAFKRIAEEKIQRHEEWNRAEQAIGKKLAGLVPEPHP